MRIEETEKGYIVIYQSEEEYCSYQYYSTQEEAEAFALQWMESRGIESAITYQ